jgi:hypothetical protein
MAAVAGDDAKPGTARSSNIRSQGTAVAWETRSARSVNQSGHFQNGVPVRLLTPWNEKRTMFFICSYQEAGMLKIFVEEAAALASIALFVGMIAVWAQLIPQF